MARFGTAVTGVIVLLLGMQTAALAVPSNDNFAAAVQVGTLPFSDTRNYTGATREDREPQSCVFSSATAWYSYTPATTGSISARTITGDAEIAAYVGSSLSGLVLAGCRPEYKALTFVAQAGRTYYFQVAAIGEATFELAVPPPPLVDIYPPFAPNSVEPVSFSSIASDPGDTGLSYAWDFDDGSTSTEANPVHQFTVDGDYQVRLTVTTTDGRTASTTRLVEVRTHDVAIVRVTAPGRARVGQTITVGAEVRNTRYDETVRVVVERSIPGGFAYVDAITQPVPVQRGNRTTRFSFSYTVTGEDRAAGTLTFRATADPDPNRDANLADNQRVSAAVTIR
ncbi:PKD domain-containing protein [Actinoplanes friuliensis]|uniref:Collagenase n=1 Tax=Actinoplanes friuliensis DSM 7358 TaxID=1246995 RepID=U5VZU8_9ACTN|nr:PKD domain-containing protein [Actinoplanes friuliensis]AGZ41245.1 collagenase [Actinoplanes friuliensis DSM 7358]